MAQPARNSKVAVDASNLHRWKTKVFEGAILFLIVVLTYLPIWPAGFSWDDNLVLTSNPVIVGPLGLKEIWTTNAADICPLTLTTFWFEHALWGLSPLPYHLVNVALHGLNAVLLWRVLRALAVPGAWLGAALWALHPVQVESAAWIAEMKNTESAFFYLLSILFFVRNLKLESGANFWNRDFGFSFLFAALAMASKSSTVVLPLVFFLCAWWLKRTISMRDIAKALPALGLAAITSLVSLWTQGTYLAMNTAREWIPSWPQRIALAGDALWFYLGKLLWPWPLMTVYPRWQIDATQAISYLPTAVMLVILIVLWIFRRTWAQPWFLVYAYFLIALLPVLGLATNTYFELSFVADHFQYLAAMGPLAFVGAGLAMLGDRFSSRSSPLKFVPAAAVLLILAILSWQRVGLYQSPEKLWTDTLAKNPNTWSGYNFLGLAAFQEGRLDEARRLYEESLALHPRYSAALFNLGLVLSQTGHGVEAMDEFKSAAEADPGFIDAHYNYANELYKAGRTDEAMDEYQTVLRLNPNHVQAHNNLGLALFEAGQLDDAITQFQAAIRVDPNFADAHYNLGLAEAQIGQLDDAIREFQEALRLDPSDTNAQKNLEHAQALKQQGAR
jgi:tetratricopeptide (TPR) repeat protein